MPKRICVVTGSRAEYGLLRPIMRAVQGTHGLALQVVVTGMHLAREFGHTVDEVVADGFPIAARVPTVPREDTNAAMAASVGTGVRGMAAAFARLRPHVVLVLGDRVEAFAAATAAALSNLVVAHVHGGDRAQAGYDDYMRHAITKMAHLHFAATPQSARRIRRLGERPDCIWVVGAPGLDEIRTAELPPIGDLLRRYLGIESAGHTSAVDRYLLVVQHPVSTRAAAAAREMLATLGAVRDVGLPALVIYPNSDPGARAMVSATTKGVRNLFQERFLTPFLVPSVPRADYLGLLKHAAALVGNSSSGIIEAPSFKTPVVNVGDRQAGRERATNVVDVAPMRAAVAAGIRKALTDPAFRRRLARCRNPYGDGHAGERIARILAGVPLGEELRLKSITY
jgi:GDP/UDP-N,N'-diacetylbacillosamine 2-epimerase (hydrolysing)